MMSSHTGSSPEYMPPADRGSGIREDSVKDEVVEKKDLVRVGKRIVDAMFDGHPLGLDKDTLTVMYTQTLDRCTPAQQQEIYTYLLARSGF